LHGWGKYHGRKFRNGYESRKSQTPLWSDEAAARACEDVSQRYSNQQDDASGYESLDPVVTVIVLSEDGELLADSAAISN
jgi:hypothetical protein